ncbi:hypothetical protein T10_943 [Trichinella papuae]|uniref:Uncharacterized protein n=1 Tax=Trichinella papuae TaxID=268474 RepID=A0A0V1MX08_9BILA|nr:hypothetical protein T10_943 [Trichinella papuae]
MSQTSDKKATKCLKILMLEFDILQESQNLTINRDIKYITLSVCLVFWTAPIHCVYICCQVIRNNAVHVRVRSPFVSGCAAEQKRCLI